MAIRSVCIGISLLAAVSIASAAEREAKSYPVKDFSAVIIGGDAEIDIVQDGTEYLRIEAETEAMQDVKVDQEGSRLTISVRRHEHGLFGWLDNTHRQVRVTLRVKQLDLLELSGAANASLHRLEGQAFTLIGRGASEIDLPLLNVAHLDVRLAGASEAHFGRINALKQWFDVSGASKLDINEDSVAQEIKVEASGASDVNAGRLVTQQAKIRASGASYINVSVSKTLVASASGASKIDYYGSPVAQADASGASRIQAHNAR